MTRPLAVVIGFLGKLPMAGMALYNLHYIAGLQELGYDVHYVERQNNRDDYYDPRHNAMTGDVAFGVEYVESCLRKLGMPKESFSVIGLDNRCYGSGWTLLESKLASADFVLNVADATWFDQLHLCKRKAFVDGDPLFTQVAMLGGGGVANSIANYGIVFTYCSRMGKPDCQVPGAGREWITTRPVIATRLWSAKVPEDPATLPVTSLMNWSAGSEIELNGRRYGQKGEEFARFIAIPRGVRGNFVLAVGGPAPRDCLREHGWQLVDPLAVTETFDSYRDFIAKSRVDFGVAKHAYVASRSGWFSDRSICYLASGRPVLHQETGFSEWLPTGTGVFSFSTVGEALNGLEEIDADYARHSRGARAIAEEFFEARTVIGQMLDEAGFR